jgi:hypothetical protein
MVANWRVMAAGVAAAAILLASGCGARGVRPVASAALPVKPVPAGPAGRGTPSPWTGPIEPAVLPAFWGTVSGPLTRQDVPFSWHPGCPVPPGALRAIRLSYVGFDGAAHAGKIVVKASVARQVVKVFSILYRARFPVRRMEPVDAFHGSDPRSMAADNTSGFNCRRAVAPGPPQWSVHAYGLAIDVNTVENPYVEAGAGVQPPAGAAYASRSVIRPGMAYTGGILVSAFRSAGWRWGGYWASSPDYQHFSVNGR